MCTCVSGLIKDVLCRSVVRVIELWVREAWLVFVAWCFGWSRWVEDILLWQVKLLKWMLRSGVGNLWCCCLVHCIDSPRRQNVGTTHGLTTFWPSMWWVREGCIAYWVAGNCLKWRTVFGEEKEGMTEAFDDMRGEASGVIVVVATEACWCFGQHLHLAIWLHLEWEKQADSFVTGKHETRCLSTRPILCMPIRWCSPAALSFR